MGVLGAPGSGVIRGERGVGGRGGGAEQLCVQCDDCFVCRGHRVVVNVGCSCHVMIVTIIVCLDCLTANLPLVRERTAGRLVEVRPPASLPLRVPQSLTH